MTPEGKVVAHLTKRVKALGGVQRKVAWEGRIGAPDRLVFLNGQTAWFELKSEKGTPSVHQLRELDLLKQYGQRAYLCFGTEQVDRALAQMLEA